MLNFPMSDQYTVELDEAYGILWSVWQEGCPPYFSASLLDDMERGLRALDEGAFAAAGSMHYFVLRSRRENVFSLGGDLDFFRQAVLSRDRTGLLAYARRASSLLHAVYSGFGRDIATVSLVQGQCLGGGLELAVSCDYLFAERHAVFCFPEISLGIFPGMGALPVLARRLGRRDYELLCHSGRTFCAEELEKMGLIDVITDTGKGEQAVLAWAKKRHAAFGSHRAMAATRKSAAALSRSEFQSGLDAWVDAVMSLDQRRLAMLSYAVRKQQSAP